MSDLMQMVLGLLLGGITYFILKRLVLGRTPPNRIDPDLLNAYAQLKDLKPQLEEKKRKYEEARRNLLNKSSEPKQPS